MEVLRIERWLTVSEPERSRAVRVHVLHSTPLAPEEVLVIDAGYEAYLQRQRRHAEQCIQALARNALGKLKEGRHNQR